MAPPAIPASKWDCIEPDDDEDCPFVYWNQRKSAETCRKHTLLWNLTFLTGLDRLVLTNLVFLAQFLAVNMVVWVRVYARHRCGKRLLLLPRDFQLLKMDPSQSLLSTLQKFTSEEKLPRVFGHGLHPYAPESFQPPWEALKELVSTSQQMINRLNSESTKGPPDAKTIALLRQHMSETNALFLVSSSAP